MRHTRGRWPLFRPLFWGHGVVWAPLWRLGFLWKFHGNSMAYHGFFGGVPCFLVAYDAYELFNQGILEEMYGGSLVRLDGGHAGQFAAGPL